MGWLGIGNSSSSSSNTTNNYDKRVAAENSTIAQEGAYLQVDNTTPEAFEFASNSVNSTIGLLGQFAQGVLDIGGKSLNASQETSRQAIAFANEQSDSEMRGFAKDLLALAPWVLGAVVLLLLGRKFIK